VYEHYALVLSDSPQTLEEALGRPDAEQWKDATQQELHSLHACGTWQMAGLPPGRNVLPVRRALKIQGDADRPVELCALLHNCSC
jgi:hypothetical protein